MAGFEYRQVKTSGSAPPEIVLPYFFLGAAAEPLNAHLDRIAQRYGAFFNGKEYRAALRGTVCTAGEALLSFYLDAYTVLFGECVSFFRLGEIWDNRRGVLLPCPPKTKRGGGWYTDGRRLILYQNTFSGASREHRRRPARSVLWRETPLSLQQLTKA